MLFCFFKLLHLLLLGVLTSADNVSVSKFGSNLLASTSHVLIVEIKVTRKQIFNTFNTEAYEVQKTHVF